MSSIRQVTPDIVELREGGGCMAVFGLPFLFAGLFVLLITCVGRGTVTSY